MQEIKVALIGNQNNNFFALLRYFINAGIKTDLLLFNQEDDFFSFDADTFEPEKYKPFVKKLNWGDLKSWQKLSNSEIEKSLDEYNFFIGCGSSPAFFSRIGKKLDIFVPYGSDLYVLPFFQLVHPLRQVAYFSFSKHQKKGIESASTIFCDKAAPEFENVVNKFKFQGNRLYKGIPFIYLPEYETFDANILNDLENFKILQKLKKEEYSIVFQYCRQMWKTKAIKKSNILLQLFEKLKGNSLQAQMVSWNLKGNNKLIEGYAKFLKNSINKKYKLVLVEYGIDCNETKKLISELQIEEHVIWLPKMPRKEIMACITQADMIVGELEFSYLTYGIVYESLLLKKLLMHFRNDEMYENEYGKLYPMLNAYSADTVFYNLKQHSENLNLMQQMVIEANEWIKNFINDNLDLIFKLIKQKHNEH